MNHMKERDVLKRLVSKNLQFALPDSFRRDIEIHPALNKIVKIAGIGGVARLTSFIT